MLPDQAPWISQVVIDDGFMHNFNDFDIPEVLISIFVFLLVISPFILSISKLYMLHFVNGF